MRLATYDRGGTWRAAVAVDHCLVDASAAADRLGVDDPGAATTVRSLVTRPRSWLRQLEEAAEGIAASDPGGGAVITDPVLGPPIPNPDKILCAGLNYREHVSEAGADEPDTPLFFAKFANSLIGSGMPVIPPYGYSDQVDYEGEVAVVLGRPAYRLTVEEAADAVIGWMPFNDVTARDLQLATTQWTVGKSPDTFGPCGPHLVIDDGGAPPEFEVETLVNGERVQYGTSEHMIFGVGHLVSYLSHVLTLVPGDVIVTGTPSGVGLHASPPRFLKDGDVMEVRVNQERLRNPVRARRDGDQIRSS